MTARRIQFRTADLDNLERPLNDFALAVQRRLDALEETRRELRVVEVLTGPSVGLGVAPFPLRLGTDATPKGLALVGLETPNSSAGLTAAPFVMWRGVSGGVELTGVVGLAVSTRYRLTLEVLYG